jgi:hypothetical protein
VGDPSTPKGIMNKQRLNTDEEESSSRKEKEENE